MTFQRTLLLSSLVSLSILLCGSISSALAQPEETPGDARAAEAAPAEEDAAASNAPSEEPAGDADSANASADERLLSESPFYTRYPTAAAYLQSIGATPSGDDEPAGDGESPSNYAFRLLFQVERLADDRLAAWTTLEDHALPEEAADLPSLAAVHWSGVVQQVERVEVPEDLFLEMAEAYVLHVRLEGQDAANWRILVSQAPQVWLEGNPDVQVSGNAIFVRTVLGGDGPLAWAVGDAPLWRPDEPNEDLGVTPSMVSLARSGMNLLDLDGLKARNKEEFAVADRDPFYAMLKATEETTPAERRAAAKTVTLVDLLTQADRYVGEAVRFPARVRRITEVQIDDSRAARALGRESYWQLDCVYDLQGQPIRMRGREGEDIVFQSTFPATVCTLDLPAELLDDRNRSLESGAEGAVNRQVEVEGYFFRLWAFPTEQTRAAGGGALQFGPLTIGTIETVEPAPYEATWLYWALLPAGLVAAGLALYLWRAARGDSVNERVRKTKLEQEGANVERLKELPTRGEPDFSHLPRKPQS